MIADAEPKGHRVQLLRSFGKPALKRGGDAHQRCASLLEMSVQTGQCDRRLPRGLRSASPEEINQGRLVMASRRASGCARRTNRLHQLYTNATAREAS